MNTKSAEHAPDNDTVTNLNSRRTESIKSIDYASPSLYQNREITWLRFNQRVLSMSRDEDLPLLERLKFIAIVCSNLDEFYMKRIGGLKQQQGAGYRELTLDGLDPGEQIALSREFITGMEQDIESSLQEILKGLPLYGIEICTYDELPEKEQNLLRRHYLENIFPLITPINMPCSSPGPSQSSTVRTRTSGIRPDRWARLSIEKF